MRPVEGRRWCPSCAAYMPAVHRCVGDGSAPPPCPTESGHPCGICERCKADQAADLPNRLRARALAYIREQHVVFTHVACHPEADLATGRPYMVAARVRGHQATYLVNGHEHPQNGRAFVWWCCGPERMESVADQCAHVAAVSLMTGWPSAAAKPAPEPEEPAH